MCSLYYAHSSREFAHATRSHAVNARNAGNAVRGLNAGNAGNAGRGLNALNTGNAENAGR
jgi:hypothetical protein